MKTKKPQYKLPANQQHSEQSFFSSRSTDQLSLSEKKDNSGFFYGGSKSSVQPFFLQRKCAACEEEGQAIQQKPGIQQKAAFESGEEAPTVQSKLTIGQVNDKYEQEADATADQVLKTIDSNQNSPQKNSTSHTQQTNPASPSVSAIQRSHASEKEDDKAPLQTKSDGQTSPQVSPQLGNKLSSSKGSGSPMGPGNSEQMDSAFGADFSKVRIHTDSNAVEMSKEIGAQAFTHSNDIYFNQGKYQPEDQAGKHLLAHELTHVVQQTGGQKGSHTSNEEKISRAPESEIQRKIDNVQPAELATFFSQPEDLLPQDLIDKYLAEPSLMANQRDIIRVLVARVQGGNAPLNANQLLNKVLGYESDLGTALIICHNITKAFARGNSPINWSNVSRIPLVYSLNGTEYTFDPNNFHRDAMPIGSRGLDSVFYAMLSFDQFGDRDEGDWYHYYALAATSYYHASGNIQADDPSQQHANTQFTGELVTKVEEALRDPAVPDSTYYQAWLRANAISFLEGGHYGQGQGEVDEESSIHSQGASAGLAAVDRIPEEGWKWVLPIAGSISLTDVLNFQFRQDMISEEFSTIRGDFELTIKSGTAPSPWYDTPDLYVQLPGSFWSRSRTTIKVDNASPLWNEVLATLSYGRLARVNLEMYDSDPISFDDLIASFTNDLRPNGKRTESFSLTSGSSSLKVSVSVAPNTNVVISR